MRDGKVGASLAGGDEGIMAEWATARIAEAPVERAPDGTTVRVLLSGERGGMAHFELPAGAVALAVRHRTVEEVWFVLAGRGRMWRRRGDHGEVAALAAGTCLTLPPGTAFQVRCDGQEPLTAVGVTMPPWPGADEAVPAEGPWSPSV